MGFRSLRRMVGLLWCSPHGTARRATHGNLASGTATWGRCRARSGKPGPFGIRGYKPLGLGAVQEICGSRPT